MRRGQKGSDNPDTVEYDIEHEYDQLGNRTLKIDHVAERMTVYSCDVDYDPNQLAYPTRHNRLLWYERTLRHFRPERGRVLRTARCGSRCGADGWKISSGRFRAAIKC